MSTGPTGVPLQPLPIGVRVRFAHAAVQVLADDCGARLLHVKGPAVDPSLARRPGESSDADVLVAPADVTRLTSALGAHGWRQRTSFETGSPFEHAANFWHDSFGYVDVHRSFPGIGVPDVAAFERLWADRQTTTIAAQSCLVPSRNAQALLLALHAARGGGSEVARTDAAAIWDCLQPAEQGQVRALAGELAADAALAAALGEPGRGATAQARLWRSYAGPASAGQRWWAQLRASRGRRRLRVLRRLLVVNTDHLQLRLGRPPTRAEIAWEALARVGRAIRGAP